MALAEKNSVVDLVYSPDDGGYYAQEYDFTRADHATRVSVKIWPSRAALQAALDSGKHRFEKWN